MVKDIPKEFCLSSYDACKDWDAMKWYKALNIRALMWRTLKESRGVKEKESCQLEALALLKDPLVQNNILHHPVIAPIIDQTVEDFFEGVSLIRSNHEYCLWYQQARMADEGIDFDELFGAETDEGLLWRLLNHRFQPAWKMHRDITPKPLSTYDRFLISVDLRAPDEILEQQFNDWVKNTRDKLNIQGVRKLFNKKDFEEWHSKRYLPLLDLGFWAETIKRRIPYSMLLEKLFEFDEEKNADQIRETDEGNAYSLITDEHISALKSQAYHYKKDLL